MEKLLIINPGSTSTKIAVYDGENQLFVESISHSAEEIAKYDALVDQFEFRKDLVLETMEKHGVTADDLTAVVARGGLLPPMEAGAYEVNEDMVWQLRYAPEILFTLDESITHGAHINAVLHELEEEGKL